MGRIEEMIMTSLETPCFIFNEAEFRKGILEFRESLVRCFNEVEIGYSVKTNSLPYALKKAKKYGCKAEVVSHDEYMIARQVGFNVDEIIYNGPMKSKETFLEAVKGGAIVNIETKRELDWLSYLPKDGIYGIGLRLNINISKVSPEDAEGEDDNSRFGFSMESNEFADAVSYIASLPNVRLSGLHIHRTSHQRSPRFYENSIRYTLSVIKAYNIDIDYLDVGGGYFGIFPNKPTFGDYVKSFYKSLQESGMSNIKLIVEPGNALTASSFSFLSEVIDVKRVDRKTVFVTTDGSRNDVDPFFRKTDYIKEILLSDGLEENRVCIPLQVVTGCTCLEYDRLFTLHDYPRLKVGDRILYKNVGAYTMTLSPLFIRLWPRVYAFDSDGKCKEVRRSAQAEDIINMDVL